ncbi:hypothetical protein BJ742DRAFT_135111 [Cladochytrium replicatum]|nr:hypothetical protein BJ742DRAFT_135111 [Cladochytrium replicatum]
MTEGEEHDFNPGELVWAKVKGFPWWPGRVEEEASEELLKHRRRTDALPIQFFGTREFSWCSKDELKPYEEFKETLSNAAKTKGFVKAVEDSKTPEILDTPIATPKRAPKASAASGEKSTGKRRASTGTDGPKKRARKSDASNGTKTPSKKAKAVIEYSDDDEADKDHSGNKEEEDQLADETGERPRRRHHSDDEKEGSGGKEKSMLEKLKKCRARLQKLWVSITKYQQRPEEKDLLKVNETLINLEQYPFDETLFKETKIAKLMKKIIKEVKLEDDKHGIVQRCEKLVEGWRKSIHAVGGAEVGAGDDHHSASPAAEDSSKMDVDEPGIGDDGEENGKHDDEAEKNRGEEEEEEIEKTQSDEKETEEAKGDDKPDPEKPTPMDTANADVA